jgi:hypothetical protein
MMIRNCVLALTLGAFSSTGAAAALIDEADVPGGDFGPILYTLEIFDQYDLGTISTDTFVVGSSLLFRPSPTTFQPDLDAWEFTVPVGTVIEAILFNGTVSNNATPRALFQLWNGVPTSDLDAPNHENNSIFSGDDVLTKFGIGPLGPGSYALQLRNFSDVEFGDESILSYTVAFIIPEPGTGILALLGIGLLYRRRP